MFGTTRWMTWVLFGLAVTASSGCGGSDKGGSAGSSGASPGVGGTESRGSGGSGGERAGSGGEESVGGSSATTGAGGVGGAAGEEEMTSSPGGHGGSAAVGGSGGMSGSAGASESGGAGGNAGSVGTFETGGASESGGTGGNAEEGEAESGGAGGASGSGGAESGGAGGASGSGDEEDQTAAQCVRDAEAAGQTITDCETCLCVSDHCQAEMNAIKDDVKANALASCGKENACAGQCCLCSTDGHGDTCTISNYASGVCADEVESAAGATPGAGLVNVGAVMMNCANNGPADNACARVTRLETCAAAKCASECPRVVVACPPS